MTWTVYLFDLNRRTIETFNIFDHWRFKEDVEKLKKDKKITKEELAEELRRDLMYYFWSKFEYEVAISGLNGSDLDKAIKVDIYQQVMLNWKRFVDYVWECKL